MNVKPGIQRGRRCQRMRPRAARGGAAGIALALAAACGASSSMTPSPPLTCSTLPNATTVLIVKSAVCPQTLTVSPGSRVLFINNDSGEHQMFSNPHHEHTDCPEINEVCALQPVMQRATGDM